MSAGGGYKDDDAPLSYAEHVKAVRELVRAAEAECRKLRAEENIPLIGAEKLKTANIQAEYTPKKHGKKMICICDDVPRRVEFIVWFKDMVLRCREIYQDWSKGRRDIQYPPGFFPPGLRPVASMLPGAVFW